MVSPGEGGTARAARMRTIRSAHRRVLANWLVSVSGAGHTLRVAHSDTEGGRGHEASTGSHRARDDIDRWNCGHRIGSAARSWRQAVHSGAAGQSAPGVQSWCVLEPVTYRHSEAISEAALVAVVTQPLGRSPQKTATDRGSWPRLARGSSSRRCASSVLRALAWVPPCTLAAA